ncbi:MAG: M20/M25/M40 family metallo-hydrolase [Actinomycetota bacterium]|nr:M20/M25/M40 family metallo-hydrolase [Actinomycetota bacterium]
MSRSDSGGAASAEQDGSSGVAAISEAGWQCEQAWARISGHRLLERTYRFVCIPSPTGDEAVFARYFGQELEAAGLEVSLDSEWPGSPSVLGRWRGRGGGPTLQLDGHTDAIPMPHREAELDHPHRIVRGRGAADMKGGLAAIAEAVRALKEAGVELRGDVLVTAHGLHEAPLGDQRTLRSLLRRGIAGDAALVAELGHDHLPVAAKGMSIFRLEIVREGKVLHEVELTDRGQNPLSALRLVLDWLDARGVELTREENTLAGVESLFVGQVHGGDFYNRVPLVAEVVGTRRYAVPHSLETVRKEFEGLCRQVEGATGLGARVELQEVGIPYEMRPHEPIITAVRRAYRNATGSPLPLGGAGAVGNAADFVASGVPAVYHGVNQSTAHSDDEFVTEEDLVRAARVYAATIVEYCGCV